METTVKNVDFINVLMEMRDGKVATDISCKFNELISAITDLRVGGKFTLTFKVRPSRVDVHEGVKELEITHDVKMEKPEKSIPRSIFFVQDGCKLMRTDPDQMGMFDEEAERRENARS